MLTTGVVGMACALGHGKGKGVSPGEGPEAGLEGKVLGERRQVPLSTMGKGMSSSSSLMYAQAWNNLHNQDGGCGL